MGGRENPPLHFNVLHAAILQARGIQHQDAAFLNGYALEAERSNNSPRCHLPITFVLLGRVQPLFQKFFDFGNQTRRIGDVRGRR